MSDRSSRRVKRETRPARPAAAAAVPTVEELWLDVLQRLCARAAHELKGALNGVAVNVEVVRSRAEKAGVPASDVTKFAAGAAQQVEIVVALTESILLLARAAAVPSEPAAVVRQVGALLAPAVRSNGRELELTEPLDALGMTTAAGNAVRLAIGAVLLVALEHAPRVKVRASPPDEPRLYVEADDGTPFAVDEALAMVLAAAGITLRREKSGLSIAFPVSARPSTSSRPPAGTR